MKLGRLPVFLADSLEIGESHHKTQKQWYYEKLVQFIKKPLEYGEKLYLKLWIGC